MPVGETTVSVTREDEEAGAEGFVAASAELEAAGGLLLATLEGDDDGPDSVDFLIKSFNDLPLNGSSSLSSNSITFGFRLLRACFIFDQYMRR